MITRVPTYNTYMNLVDQTMNLKTKVDLYSYQMTTGIRYQEYSGYGMQAHTIVNLESMLGVTSNYIDSNKLITIENNALTTALESIQSSMTDFKSTLVSAIGMDLESASPDSTGGSLTFGSNNVADYMNTTLTVNGVQYTFSNNNTGNNIDISGAQNGTEVMQALQNKLPANPEFSFEGDTFTFPLYTIDGTSSVLEVTGVTTGDPHVMSDDQYNQLTTLQNTAFSTMKMLVDALNTQVNGKYIFGGGETNTAPISFPFGNLEEFQDYYDGENILFPSNPSALMCNKDYTTNDTGAITIASTGGNTGTLTAANAGAFLNEAVNGNAQTTGELTFSTFNNTITATQNGAFNTISEGDSLVISGDGAGANAKVYTVKSISADGKTITVDDSTPIEADLTITPDNTDTAQTVNFQTSLPVGTILNMNGFNDNNLASHIQITGVSADGSTLTFTANPSQIPNTTYQPSKDITLEAESYYEGGSLVSKKVISDNQSITFDITGGDVVFQKMFEALGTIAQGNIVDSFDATQGETGDINTTLNRLNTAMDWVSSSIYSSGVTSQNVTNPDIYTVLAKVNSNSVVLNNVTEMQTTVEANLENSIYSIKNVDQNKAAIMALMAMNNLNASYACLQQVMNISLLNYM